jgi:GNAT superfamily N-acetyltransferase
MVFSLHPATISDAAVLAQISDASFSTDSHTRLKALYKGPDDFRNGMNEAISSWTTNPKCSVVKAVDDESGEILGWICWAKRGFEDDKTQEPSQESQAEEVAAAEAETAESKAQDHESGQHSEEVAALEERPLVDQLGDLTNASMEEWQARLMPPGTKCMFIVAISVLPAHQGRGVGSALIRWGTAQADQESVFCWVHSSHGGWKAFAKQGFVEVGKLVVDLDDFADDGHREDADGWGEYIFRYMKRPARNYLPKDSQA